LFLLNFSTFLTLVPSLCRQDHRLLLSLVVYCSCRMWERVRERLTWSLWTLHQWLHRRLAHRRVSSFAMRRGLSRTSIMPMTFLTLAHLVPQCHHNGLSGLSEKVNPSTEIKCSLTTIDQVFSCGPYLTSRSCIFRNIFVCDANCSCQLNYTPVFRTLLMLLSCK